MVKYRNAKYPLQGAEGYFVCYEIKISGNKLEKYDFLPLPVYLRSFFFFEIKLIFI
jgi:hypothetical protein